MELLWQNGQVVVQSQTQMSVKKAQHHKYDDAVLPVEQSTPREIQSSSNEQQQHLFMQEDEMASWLHYPLNDTNFDQDFCADLLYPSTGYVSSTTTNTAASEVLDSEPVADVSVESTTVDSLTTFFKLDGPDSDMPPFALCLEKWPKFCTTSALLVGGIGGLEAEAVAVGIALAAETVGCRRASGL